MEKAIADVFFPEIEDVKQAQNNLSQVIYNTPLQYSFNLSERFDCKYLSQKERIPKL